MLLGDGFLVIRDRNFPSWINRILVVVASARRGEVEAVGSSGQHVGGMQWAVRSRARPNRRPSRRVTRRHLGRHIACPVGTRTLANP